MVLKHLTNFSLMLLWLILPLSGCNNVKPKPTFPPIPTIISRTKAPSSLDANPAIGIGIDIDVEGFVTRKEHGLGTVIELKDSYLVSYVPVDKTYLFEIRLPKNFKVGSYPIQQSIYVNNQTLYVLQPDNVGAMFMFIQDGDRSYDDIVFDRGTYFGSNVDGNITIANLNPFSGNFSFSGQDELGTRLQLPESLLGLKQLPFLFHD